MNKLYIEENVSSNDIIKEIAIDNNLSDYVVLKNKNGKPYFKGNDIYFNISNKDNITVAVTSFNPVGIDIEKLTFKLSVVKHFFSKNEHSFILLHTYIIIFSFSFFLLAFSFRPSVQMDRGCILY